MSVIITSLEAGRRLKLVRSMNLSFSTFADRSLRDAGYKGPEPKTTITSGTHIAPEGAGFIVVTVKQYDNSIDGYLVWREGGDVCAGFVRGMHPDYLDSVRGAMRLPGEPKPGSGDALKAHGTKTLSEAERAQLGNVCPQCGKGVLNAKTGRFGEFVGCSHYPHCQFIWKANRAPQQEAQAQPQAPQQDALPTPPAQAPRGDDAAMLAEILRRLASQNGVDEAAVRKIVLDELQRVQPGKVEYHIKVQDQEPRKLQGRPHKLMPEILRRAQARDHKGMRFAQLLVGEAGTGKSTLCEHVAAALGLSYTYISCSGGMSESKLVGRLTPSIQNGDEKYTPTPLVHAWEFGGVTMIDEIDGADPNVLLVLNGMMEATFWTTPDGRTIQRHADFILVAAANTYGQGADRKYVGRNQLDAAFLDRWMVATVDYDTDLEASLVTTEGFAPKWAACRQKIREIGSRRTLSTRSLLRADVFVQQLGYTREAAIIAATEGWTQEERSKVGLL